MSDDNREVDVLFVNGVNTEFGGAVSQVMKSWGESFAENGVSHEIFSTVPKVKTAHKGRSYFFFLDLYFLPGTLFRMFVTPIFEFTYKISPVVIVRFLWRQLTLKSRKVIFSHHSSFYLSVFTRRKKRLFIIHDLMCARAKAGGASRRVQRLCLVLELLIYRLSPTLLVLSYHESRILRRFLPNRIHLIGCCSFKVLGEHPVYKEGEFAVVSDWRRPENVRGAIRFFSSKDAASYGGNSLRFKFFGFGCEEIIETLKSAGLSPHIDIAYGGVFKDMSGIAEGYFFVPIYEGAGIKIKVLEALHARRVVVGTQAAFVGLPPWIIANVTHRVTSINDIQFVLNIPDEKAFTQALNGLSMVFNGIGEVLDMSEGSG